MIVSDDMKLLRSYAAGNSEEAFSTLVSRHINLVYSAALRVVQDSHQAEEVAQAVFLTLARKAHSLDSATILSGWLYQTARLTACNTVRAEVRRRQREQQAQLEATMNDSTPELWTQVGPQLEEAMAELNEKDRDAIVLRYFQGKLLKEVGEVLGTTEDAAKMRVNRALEKLRNFFIRRGITMPEALLAAALAENSVLAAPAGLAASITTTALEGAATVTAPAILKGVLYTMSSAKISAVIGLAAATVIAVQWHQVSTIRESSRQLEAQLAAMTQTNRAQAAEIEKLDAQVASASKSISAMARDAAKSRANAGAARDAKRLAEAARKALAASEKGGPFAAMFKDPDMMKAMREQSAAVIRMQYAQFVNQMHLTDEQAESFYKILIDKGQQGLEALQSGDFAAAAKQSIEPQLRQLLGDDGYNQYKDYSMTLADRTMLNTYKNSFVDEPLTSTQEQQLLQIMTDARKATSANTPNNATLNSVGQAAMMDQAMSQQSQINQNVLQQASSFLSPVQLQSLGTAQSNFLNMEKVGMTMAQKMFTNMPGQMTQAASGQ